MATTTSKAKATSSEKSIPKKPAPQKTAVKKTASSAKTTASKANSVHKSSETPVISDDQIAKRAFEIWQEEGCPSDRGDANWLQAERELKAKAVSQ